MRPYNIGMGLVPLDSLWSYSIRPYIPSFSVYYKA